MRKYKPTSMATTSYSTLLNRLMILITIKTRPITRVTVPSRSIPGLNKYREILEKDNLDPNLLDVIWWPGYLERVELNPYLPET